MKTSHAPVKARVLNEVDPPPTLTVARSNPLLKPMTSTSVEIGWKGFEELEALRQHLEYSVARFRIGVANEIVPYNGGAFLEPGLPRNWFASVCVSIRI